jgi:hypothetical protein
LGEPGGRGEEQNIKGETKHGIPQGTV